MHENHEFAVWFKQLRTQRGLTPEHLAQQIRSTETEVHAIEQGLQRPGRELAQRLADLLLAAPDERERFVQLALLPAGYEPESGQNLMFLRPVLPPRPQNELIGREQERAELLRHLHTPNHRLITLLGPGGMGKTSLALHLAALLAETADPISADGVAVAWLAALHDPHDVPMAIATALGIPLQGSRPVADLLIDALYDRMLVLVLDNAEHLLGSENRVLPELITRLLGAPNVRCIVTSRERLRLRDEWVYELQGLDLPTRDQGLRVDQAHSVRLFLERAQRVAPDFVLTAQNRAAVAHICRRLEGLPLAIELAATWIRALSPAEIAAEIDRALDLLTLTNRDMPARHQSMRAALDHSWQLLDTDERYTLARLSVFRGGCERDAARTVTGATLMTLTSLIDKSLVRVETAGALTRYRLHELVRQYAAERLADDPADRQATVLRHSEYYTEQIRIFTDPRTGTFTIEGQNLLDRNIDNLRAAWEYAIETRNVSLIGMTISAFWQLYDLHSSLHDAVALFQKGIDVVRTVEGAAPVLGLLMGVQSYFLTRIARYHEARRISEEGIKLLQENQATNGLAGILFYSGVSLSHVGQFDTAIARLSQAIALAQGSSDAFIRMWADTWLGLIAVFRGEYDQARALMESFRATFRDQQHYQRGEGTGLASLGEIARCQGRFHEATTYLQQGLHLGGQTNDNLIICTCLCQLGALAWQNHEYDEARYLLQESATIAREMGDQWLAGRALTFLVRVEIANANPEAARLACVEIARATLDGEAMLLGDALFGYALLLHHTGNHAEARELLHLFATVEVKHELKPEAAALGQTLDALLPPPATTTPGRAAEPWLRELIARKFQPQVPAAPVPVPPTPVVQPKVVQAAGLFVPTTGETLSPREVDVLQLVVRGANNAEIAQQLVISLHTVKTHVAHILAKLNVASRTAAAVRARELGIT